MTYYLGIDVGKFFHQGSLIDEKGLLVGASLKFENTLESMEDFFSQIQKRLPFEAILRIGLESTGHYWFGLRNFFFRKGIKELVVFNPIETKERAKTRIRKVKNDRIDSLEIAKMVKEKKLCSFSLKNDEDLTKLKKLTRFVEKMKSQEKRFKQEITSFLEVVWPEFESFFANVFAKTPLVVLEYLIKNQGLKEKKLIPLVKQTSRSRIKEEKVKELIGSFDTSLGQENRDENTFFCLKMLLDNLKNIQKQIKELKEKVEEFGEKFPKIKELIKIKGISKYLACVCLAEIGDVERFSNPDKLVAFAGLDPSVCQSGLYLRKQGNHISKRGSKYLRMALYFMAKTAVIHEPEFREYYLKKKVKGKHYNIVIIAVANRMLRMIYRLLKQKKLEKLFESTSGGNVSQVSFAETTEI